MPKPIEGNFSVNDPVADYLSAFAPETPRAPVTDEAHLGRIFESAVEIAIATKARFGASLLDDGLLAVETNPVSYQTTKGLSGAVALRGTIKLCPTGRDKKEPLVRTKEVRRNVDMESTSITLFALTNDEMNAGDLFRFRQQGIIRLFPHTQEQLLATPSDASYAVSLLTKMRKSYGIPEKVKK